MKPIPLHERIRSEIETAILDGRLRPGDRIPKETELMEAYGCARMTVNKALSALAATGMVERRKRAGSFVARPRTQSMVLDVPDLGAEIESRGQTYDWRLLRRTRVEGEATRDGPLNTQSPVLVVEGIHLADGQPLAHETREINLGIVPAIADADLTHTPPGTWLIANVPWTEAENRISALGCGPQVARALGIAAGAPCLVLDRHTWRGNDMVTHVRQHYVAGLYEFVARFGAATS